MMQRRDGCLSNGRFPDEKDHLFDIFETDFQFAGHTASSKFYDSFYYYAVILRPLASFWVLWMTEFCRFRSDKR